MHKDRQFKPLTDGQAEYIQSIVENDIIFCTGPAGTGKTSVAIGYAVNHIESLHPNATPPYFDKVILSRPTVDLEEEKSRGIGFLPGDIYEKMNPYLIPVLEEIKAYSGNHTNNINIQDAIRNGSSIEICPLEFMRGRTFKRTVVIIDEAQNATYKQIKAVLTRIGHNSKVIINGDITQADRRRHDAPALLHFCDMFRDVDGFGVVELTTADIVRHKIIETVLKACEEFENRNKNLVY